MKNPRLAAYLSLLFPGMGQMYNGQMLKGMLFSLLQLVCHNKEAVRLIAEVGSQPRHGGAVGTPCPACVSLCSLEAGT